METPICDFLELCFAKAQADEPSRTCIRFMTESKISDLYLKMHKNGLKRALCWTWLC